MRVFEAIDAFFGVQIGYRRRVRGLLYFGIYYLTRCSLREVLDWGCQLSSLRGQGVGQRDVWMDVV